MRAGGRAWAGVVPRALADCRPAAAAPGTAAGTASTTAGGAAGTAGGAAGTAGTTAGAAGAADVRTRRVQRKRHHPSSSKLELRSPVASANMVLTQAPPQAMSFEQTQQARNLD